jgi:hypothetical protein
VAPGDTLPAETVEGPPPVTSPSCLDGAYDEVLPFDAAPLDALIAGYAASEYLAFADGALAARYPFGRALVVEAVRLGEAQLGNCVERFTSDRGTARGLMRELSTVVHECGHMVDLLGGTFTTSRYVINEQLTLACSGGDAVGRGGDTFARSRLNQDAYGALLPGDFYRDIYLDGDPDDGVFDGGDQGFNSVLEEAVQYVNSLATDWAFRDALGGLSISSRDGILTFLWYIERYLALARREDARAYQRLSGDACWREAILTLWGRAWLYLDLTQDIPSLGLADDEIEALVLAPELLEEIDRLRQAHGCE